MILQSLELINFRNYDYLSLDFDSRVNILYGDNAQGKTNVLEAIYVSVTTKSHKGCKDREMIRFGEQESHIRTTLEEEGVSTRIDMHLRAGKSKAVAIDGARIRKASQLLGILNVIFFSPEDLSVIKNDPSKRRRFIDMELCQLDSSYLNDLGKYNKALMQRNQILKDLEENPSLSDVMPVWDDQLMFYGKKITERREKFIGQLNEIIFDIHRGLTGGKENIRLLYRPSILCDHYEEEFKKNIDRDIKRKITSVGPHRDDFSFDYEGCDFRKFGSQGQQRTAALSLKLSEIELVKSITGKTPLLLLDDVLSELDSGRQNELLNILGNVQTVITCTGLEEFVKNRFPINKVFRVAGGKAIREN